MKKLVALLLVAMMLCASMAALAESPEGYPEVVEGIDFGGATLYVWDYWSSSSNDRKADPSEEEAAQYAYRDWIMDTYNVKIEQIAKGGWDTNHQELLNFYNVPEEGVYALFILPPDYVGGVLANNALAAWNNDYIDLTDTEEWSAPTTDFMTVGDKTYGVFRGMYKGASEPRNCLYFNKRVLSDAGIDPESIYDMVQDGTWTWDVLEDMLKTIQQDTDNDGTIDIYGMTGNANDLYRVAVVNNGGSFFEKDENGKIFITAGSDNTLEALAWSKALWNDYAYKGVAGDDGSVVWNFYVDAWNQGFCGFYIYQTYGGFNDNSEMLPLEDEWGCVPFPVGPKGDTFYHVASDNVTVIPAVYDDETVAKMTYIYKLWSDATPGYDGEDSWIGNKYNYTDDRAIEETYVALMQPEHTFTDVVLALGSVNDVEGNGFLWELQNSTPAELLESVTPKWQGLIDAYNEKVE